MSDRVIGLLQTVVAGWARASAHSRLRTIKAVDRELTLVVADTTQAADGVLAVTLTAPDSADLPPWHPGAHLDLVLPSGKVRQYSLCGAPADRGSYTIAVRRIADGGGGSIEVHGLTVGTPVTVRGPRNGFPFAYPHLAMHDIERVAFIAGGIGITALLPMVHAAADAGVPWSLTYVGRSRETMPFLDEIENLPGGEVRVILGLPAMEEVLASVGVTTSVYFCGPPPFLDAVARDLQTRPHAGFHFERFSPPPVIGGEPFTVTLARTGCDIDVPANRSALAAIREALPDVAYSCQQGFCGTCRVGVTSGSVAKRGTARFLDRPDSMLTCVDRADGDHLTLDL